MNNYENEMNSLFKVMDRVRKVWRSVTPCEELSKSQFGTLMAISHLQHTNPELSCISLTELASYMHQSNPALSQRIRTLEELAYVERVSNQNDRRINGVRLSVSGEKILNLAHLKFRNILSEVIENFGVEETNSLITSLNKLADAFETSLKQEDCGGLNNEKN